ncbi:MAG: hypothetical protein AAFY88_05585 [Acidobacteriota bacterium]
MKKLSIGGALILGSLFAALPAAAQQCSELEYRIWRQNAAPEWYSHGETLEVKSGEEVHIYIHQRGRTATSRYSAAAEIGYPANFGGREDSRKVREHIRMSAQNGDDKRSGRIRLVAEAPGSTRLGYRITGVKSPGDINRINRACRTGLLNVTVLGRGGNRPTPAPGPNPNPGAVTPGDAANELVDLLYRGLLRRERQASDPDSFVRDALQFGKSGLERIAETMTVSDEFRYQALKRVEARRGSRGDLGDLRSALLDEIYRDLYGYLTPNRDDRQADLDDLDRCLSNDRGGQEACGRLGRNLIDSSLFYEQNQRLIDGLRPDPRRRR